MQCQGRSVARYADGRQSQPIEMPPPRYQIGDSAVIIIIIILLRGRNAGNVASGGRQTTDGGLYKESLPRSRHSQRADKSREGEIDGEEFRNGRLETAFMRVQ